MATIKKKPATKAARKTATKKGQRKTAKKTGKAPGYKLVRDSFDALLSGAASSAKKKGNGSLGSSAGRPDPGGGAHASFPFGPFPDGALPPLIRSLCLDISAVNGVPVAFPAGAFLAVGAATIGRQLQMANDIGPVTANLYMALSASSGTGKKLVFDRCMKPFVDLHRELSASWKRDVQPRLELRLRAKRAALRKAEESHAEVLGTPLETEAEQTAINIANDVRLTELDLQRCPVLHLTDPNMLALARTMQGQQGEACAVMSSEAVGSLAGLIGAASGNSQGSEGFACMGYSGDAYLDERLSREGITLHHPCLTLAPFIQPDIMQDMLTDRRLIDRGVMPRFLLVNGDDGSRPSNRAPRKPGLDDQWKELVRSLTMEYRMNRGQNTPFMIATSTEVKAVFSHYRREIEQHLGSEGEFVDIGSFVRRWPEQASRIALVLHALLHGVNAHRHPMTDATAQAAVRIGKWFAAQQLEMLDGHRIARHHARAEKLRRIVLQYPDSTATLGRLGKSHGFKEDEVQVLCRDFPKLIRLAEKRTGAGGGRPTMNVIAA